MTEKNALLREELVFVDTFRNQLEEVLCTHLKQQVDARVPQNHTVMQAYVDYAMFPRVVVQVKDDKGVPYTQEESMANMMSRLFRNLL